MLLWSTSCPLPWGFAATNLSAPHAEQIVSAKRLFEKTSFKTRPRIHMMVQWKWRARPLGNGDGRIARHEGKRAMEAVLGIDIGGTSIKAGLFTPEGELLEERKIPTPELTSDEAFAIVTDGLAKILAAHDAAPEDVIACGLDIPGPVADDGTVGFLPNIQLDPEGLVGAITATFPRAQVAFVNDANAAALGEMWAGVAHGASSYVLIALGTGVGAGVVVNGRLVAGAGAGGEIGHITVNPAETSRAAVAAAAALSSTPRPRASCASTSPSASAAASPRPRRARDRHPLGLPCPGLGRRVRKACRRPDVRVPGPGHGPGLLRR